MDLRNHFLRVWAVLNLFEVGTNGSLSSGLWLLAKGRMFLKLFSVNQIVQKNSAFHLVKWQKDESVAYWHSYFWSSENKGISLTEDWHCHFTCSSVTVSTGICGCLWIHRLIGVWDCRLWAMGYGLWARLQLIATSKNRHKHGRAAKREGQK